jgi:hypothetical protein
MLAPNTGMTIPIGALGQNVFKVTVYEKDGLVTNYFEGVVKRGSATAIYTVATSGVSLSIATPTGTVGTSGNLNLFVRADVLYLNNLTSTAGNFVVLVEGAGRS